MSFVIENKNDLINFGLWVDKNPQEDIVYTWMKNYYEVEYVGYSNRTGRKKITYLKNHHTIPKLAEVFRNEQKIVIYLKYDEHALITFFKPRKNKAMGKTIGRRKIYRASWEEYDGLVGFQQDVEIPSYLSGNYGKLSSTKYFNFYIDIFSGIIKTLNIDLNLIYKNKYKISEILSNFPPKKFMKVLLYIWNNIKNLNCIENYYFLEKLQYKENYKKIINLKE